MKTAKDPRHLHRIKIMQTLFSWDFKPDKKGTKEIAEIVSNIDEIDKIISKAAPDRPIDKINKIDLAILRLSVFELIIKRDAPPKVIIDEAIELGKEFGSDSSAGFINGALGKVVTLKGIKT